MAKKHLGCADSNCGYYWQDEGEDHPSCHFPSNDPFPAPCEEDDWDAEPAEEEDEDYEQVLALLPCGAGNNRRCRLL